MKVLILGNSNDTGAWVKQEEKRHIAIGEQLAAEFGGPVEVIAKNAWPNERMLSFVTRWLEETQPDLVFLNVTAYPFCYESTPLKVRRILKRVGGEAAGDAGMRIAQSKRWAHNALFRTVRKLAQATIGGDTHFTPSEIIARQAEVIRLTLRREGTVIAVKGPLGRSRPGLTRRERSRHERKRQQVHTALSELCAHLHVPYYGADEPFWKTRPVGRDKKVGDGLHSNAAGHQMLSEDHHAFIRDAWAKHMQQVGSPANKPS